MLVLRKACVFTHEFPDDSVREPNSKYISTPAGRNVALHIKAEAESRQLQVMEISLDHEHESWDFWVESAHPGFLECKVQRFECSILWIDFRMSIGQRLKCMFRLQECCGLLEGFCGMIEADGSFKDLIWTDGERIGEAENAVISRHATRVAREQAPERRKRRRPEGPA